MFFLQEQIMICSWKSNIFDTFAVLNLNPNEKKNTFSKSVSASIQKAPKKANEMIFAFRFRNAVHMV
jgi:hypothetical protein